jgi:hypothetical protein
MTLLRLDNRRKKFYQVIATEMYILLYEWSTRRKSRKVMPSHLPKEGRRGANPAKMEASSLAITSDH